jgi:hypothetical protein
MPSKYDAINKLKAENPELTWTQAANRAGFSGEWTSYKGKAKPRTGDARGQARRRTAFDQPSTELAGYEAKRLQQESTRISAEAEMFGLEPTQIEHLADQEDVRNLTAGSGGDPTNKAIVTQTEARFKDRVKQLAPSGYAVTLNPTTDSVRVIENRFFDPIADPSTLPGIDIPIGSNIEEGLAEIKPKGSLLSQFSPYQRQQLEAAPTLEAKENLINQFKADSSGTKINALRVARNLAPAMLSIPAGMAVTGQSAAAAVKNPTQDNIVNAGFDAANTIADLVGLIPTPMTIGASEAAQRALMMGQMGYNAQRRLQRMMEAEKVASMENK